MRQRDKKGYPQFTNRIIEWKSARFRDGKPQLVRVVGVDYHVGVTFVGVENPDKKFTCYNGPLSPQKKEAFQKNPERLVEYDKAFEYIIKILRSNSMYSVQEIEEVQGKNPDRLRGSMTTCSFGI